MAARVLAGGQGSTVVWAEWLGDDDLEPGRRRELFGEPVGRGARPGEHDLTDGPRLRLRKVEVDRETDLLGKREAVDDAGVVCAGCKRTGEQAVRADRDGEVGDCAEVA